MNDVESPPWPTALRARTDLREQLLAAYTDPRRGYHDLRHLTEVVVHARDLAREESLSAAALEEVLMAAWFHDAVYDGDRDDEDRSAALAEQGLTGAGVDPVSVAEVVRLVHLTKTHDAAPEDLSGQVLCDADLAILAAPPERYGDYLAGVRVEYSHLDDESFRRGRGDVLQTLLSRRSIFATATARARWEDAARANITSELSGIH